MNNFRKLKYVTRDVQLVVCDVGKIDMPQFKKKKKKEEEVEKEEEERTSVKDAENRIRH